MSSQIVYENRNSNVGLGETIRFQVPASVAILNSAECYLRFNMVVGVKGAQTLAVSDEADVNHYFPWTLGKGGASNLIRNLTIRANGQIIEQITDYNRLNRVLCNYVENSSQSHLKQLYEGSDTDYVASVNTLTRRPINAAGASTQGLSQENMEVEVCLPLRLSGVFNNSQPFPNGLAPIECEILLEENVYNVIHAQSFQLGADAPNFKGTKNVQSVGAGYINDTMPYKVDGTPNAAGQTSIKLLNVTNGGDNVFNSGNVSVTDIMKHPFFNGMTCVVEGTANIEVTVDTVQVTNNQIELNFAATDFSANIVANPKVYVKVGTGGVLPTAPTITLSEMQLVVGTVDATPAQLSALQSAKNSSNGYGYTYKSYGDFPVNMSSGALVVSNLVNCKYQMAKSILSFWENTGDVKFVNKDNLLCDVSTEVNPKSYQYKLHSLMVPNRSISLSQYIRTRSQPGGWSAGHIKELSQSLACCGYKTKDLSNIDGCLLVGRGLVPGDSGYTHSFADNDEIRLNMQFAAQSQNLLQHNFVCHNKSFVIKQSGSFVVE